MAHTLRLTNAKGGPWYEYYHEVCPICGHSGGCMVHGKGDRVICIRVTSKREWAKNSSMPGYLHHLNEKKSMDTKDFVSFENSPKKSDSELDRYFRSFIRNGKLTDKHRQHLWNRPLTNQQIERREYRSFPDEQQILIRAMMHELGVKSFKGVPGFYSTHDYTFIHGFPNSFLIPYRSVKNEIVGFQMRVDDVKNKTEIKDPTPDFKAIVSEQPNYVKCSVGSNVVWEGTLEFSDDWTPIMDAANHKVGEIKLKKGTRYFWLSSAKRRNGTGAGDPPPVHISIPSADMGKWEPGQLHRTETVWLGEGALKGDIAVDRLTTLYRPEELALVGTTFVNVPGVNSWRIAMPTLKAMGAKTVNVAFDADAVENPYVKKHLFDCLKELKKEGYHANLVVWNPIDGKGIDDTLIAGKLPQFQRLF